MTGEKLTELELMRVKSAYSAGFTAGLEAANKDAVSSLTGMRVQKKVWMPCPACGKQSPMQDPDADLLAALKELLEACKGAKFARDPFDAVPNARSAIAKATGGAA
mgnify:CR=1 FL=1